MYLKYMIILNLVYLKIITKVNLNKRWTILKKILLVFCLCSIFFSCASQNSAEKIKIAIFQSVQHPTLDLIKDNITVNVKNEHPEYFIKEFNSQGDIATGISIAHQINNGRFDIVIAIATPSAQIAAKHIKNIPIVFSSVAYPIAAGIVDNLEKPGNNITGVSNMIDTKMQFEFIKKVNPSLKNIGVIYNTSEVNSQIFLSNFEKESADFSINVITSGVVSSNEVYEAALSLISKVDAVLMILDNTVAASFTSLLNVCKKFDKPLYVLDKTYVDLGADAGLSIDYNYLSLLTYEIAIQILKGTPASNIPVKTIDKYEIYFNRANRGNQG